MSFDRRDFLKYMAASSAAFLAASCAPNFLIADTATAWPQPSLRELAARQQIIFGSAADWYHLRDPAYTQLLVHECASITPENSLKFSHFSTDGQRFDFTKFNRLAGFINRHQLQWHGHTLVWHKHAPTQPAAMPKAADFLPAYIKALQQNFAATIWAPPASYDVVNEAIRPADNLPHGLRQSFWLDYLGADYIADAFHAAHQAWPTSTLYYNDFDLEYAEPHCQQKRAATLALLRRMLKQNVPIHGLGIQSHLSAARHYNSASWQDFLRAVQDLGLVVHLSELDVSDIRVKAPPLARLTKANTHLTTYLADTFAILKPKQITCWGLAEQYNWRKPGGNGNPKGIPTEPTLYNPSFQPTAKRHILAAALSRLT